MFRVASNSWCVSLCITPACAFWAFSCSSFPLGSPLSPSLGACASILWALPLPWTGARGSNVHLFPPCFSFCNGWERYLQRLLTVPIPSRFPHGLRQQNNSQIKTLDLKPQLFQQMPPSVGGAATFSVCIIFDSSLFFLPVCRFAPDGRKIFGFSCRRFSQVSYLCHLDVNREGEELPSLLCWEMLWFLLVSLFYSLMSELSLWLFFLAPIFNFIYLWKSFVYLQPWMITQGVQRNMEREIMCKRWRPQTAWSPFILCIEGVCVCRAGEGPFEGGAWLCPSCCEYAEQVEGWRVNIDRARCLG